MVIGRGMGILALWGALLIAAPAAAQQTEGAFQLGLGTPLVSYTSSTLENDENGSEIDTSTLQWGIRGAASLEFGYGVSELIVVGGVLVFGGVSQTVEPENSTQEFESSQFQLFLGPKIDAMFSAGAEVRPFVGAAIGLTAASEDGTTLETSLLGVQLVGRVGIRCFAAPGFSLDPALMFAWTTAGGDIESTGGDAVDISASGFAFSLALTASGWL